MSYEDGYFIICLRGVYRVFSHNIGRIVFKIGG
jgi:hypothetical protein